MEHKLTFAGPVGAGKTTAIESISDIEVVRTDAGATDDTLLRKARTTVAMDYGMLNLEGGVKLHLYGTPGQERFSFMWDILAQGSIGLVLLVDNCREDPLADLELYLDSFNSFVQKNAVVVGVTRMDIEGRPGLNAYHSKLAEMGLNLPVLEMDARERSDIKALLLVLMSILDPTLKR
ncbi:GTP-binding protein [Thiohalomonas denitrificans]|uniref:Signal recognition particle receptor subunit beta, a GTPase n=1 Tax=Thiohalomonas denitrificans TaxID=415747 RepID=A0A1G5QD49_9GAMM|nr:ATP/GTP-binding protein [Thiohalomonas denitrificans]SCZ59291.1 hypothetical protein SAMN03097708_01832 [Thiohalomonas denitrificans]